MVNNRRDMLSLLSLACSSALLLPSELGNPQDRGGQLGRSPQSGSADQESVDFWTRDIRNPETGEPGARGIQSVPRVSFLYYDERNGFLTGSDIGDDGLRDSGDFDVLINVDHVRPSVADQNRFVNLEGGSLRIDVQQGAALPSLGERLAWTAIAGFLPENKRLPPLKEMSFDPATAWGKLQSIPLPGGGGRWTWNFFLQKKKSRWMQILDAIRRTRGLLTPIFGLGLPAIAITSLMTVDSLVAEVTRDEKTEWLFQSPDAYFYSTRKARDLIEGSKVRLKKGMYVIMPSDKLSTFANEQSRLTIKDGLIVPKNTPGLEVEDAAKETAKDITYLTVGVSLKYRPLALR